MSKYDKIYNELLKRRDELESRTNKIRKDYATPLNKDWNEQAVELENAEVLSKLDRGATDELAQIYKTLKLIENDKYGKCTDCGKPIPEKRLEALSYTIYCIACASKR